MPLAIAALVLVLLLPVAPRSAHAQLFVDVRQVSTDTIRDVAMTIVSPTGRPTIFYNPVLMQQVGPKLAAFAMAHEYGHVRYSHVGGFRGANDPVRQRQELEADCYAARILGDTNPEAIDAAIQFFRTMGPFRFDRLHPAGAQRAAELLACRSENGTEGTISNPVR